jgi:hypothetical protein
MKHLLIKSVVLVLFCFFTACNMLNQKPEKLEGTNLYNYVSKGPFKICVKDLNQPESEFTILLGNGLLFSKFKLKDGSLVEAYYEDKINAVTTKTVNQDGDIEREYSSHGKNGDMDKSYFDTDNDGVFDLLIDFNTDEVFEWKGKWVKYKKRG